MPDCPVTPWAVMGEARIPAGTSGTSDVTAAVAIHHRRFVPVALTDGLGNKQVCGDVVSNNPIRLGGPRADKLAAQWLARYPAVWRAGYVSRAPFPSVVARGIISRILAKMQPTARYRGQFAMD
ncbi:hypothetical protein CPLU01_01574 [Colletotrichum plurivorum]|uniref:Uncharacterized protein n=1 Tax=Colletotrichum plurivorum TaxID=2175906 RepID=A0A8H6NN34_9PEZI|nr:hypothetical protein CPLU01_01574 [Colletotrichum plurivorum]